MEVYYSIMLSKTAKQNKFKLEIKIDNVILGENELLEDEYDWDFDLFKNHVEWNYKVHINFINNTTCPDFKFKKIFYDQYTIANYHYEDICELHLTHPVIGNMILYFNCINSTKDAGVTNSNILYEMPDKGAKDKFVQATGYYEKD